MMGTSSESSHMEVTLRVDLDRDNESGLARRLRTNTESELDHIVSHLRQGGAPAGVTDHRGVGRHIQPG